MKYWWDRFPGLEQNELNSLQEAGITFEKNSDAWKIGKLVLHINFPVEVLNLDFAYEKKILVLDAYYPDTYPFFKPEIFAREESFERHQNPFEKNLCLIGRSSDNWESDWSIADYLKSQLPKILKINVEGVGAEFTDSNEEHQGEPLSEFLPFRKEGEVFFIGDWVIPNNVRHGMLKVGNLDSDSIRGVVFEVEDEDRNVIKEFSLNNLRCPIIMTVPWVHLAQPLSTADPVDYLHKILETYPRLQPKPGKRFIGAVVFSEEGKWKKETDAWVFVVADPRKPEGVLRKGKGRKKITGSIKKPTHDVYFVRAQRADKTALHGRIPELSALNNKKILLFGLGSIGAPIALEMARGGIGEMVLVDYDIAEAGPSVRWPFGMASSGKRKCEILNDFIHQNYPSVKVKPKHWRVGDIAADEIEIMNDIIEDVDIIIDATAEHGVHHFLSSYASEIKIPYVWVVGRPGGWGGIVGRVMPEKTEGCWLCYTHSREDKKTVEPPSSPEKSHQPTGCADPAFSGAGFDMTTIALTGVRMVVGTLCSEVDEGYPNLDSDVISIALRDKNGNAIPPKYSEFSISIHHKCSSCSDK